jgi:hypothetical protein
MDSGDGANAFEPLERATFINCAVDDIYIESRLECQLSSRYNVKRVVRVYQQHKKKSRDEGVVSVFKPYKVVIITE